MRIGIDLGGSKIEGIILDAGFQLRARQRIDTPAGDYNAIVNAVVDLVAMLQSEAGQQLTVGIGTPGSLSPDSGLMRNCNSTCLNGKPLKQDLEKLLGYNIRLENDANCFALTEALMGAGRDYKSVFGVIIGTGTGGGIVINKSLLTGPNGIAGEWGHNTVPAAIAHLLGKARPCYCGRSNCIETVLSGPGMSLTHQEHAGSALPAKRITELARAGDEAAMATLARYSEMLAGCLATVINVVDPEVIVLGGGLSNIETLYQDVPRYLASHVFSDAMLTTLSPPAFGDASGARGAACLWS